jgi:hypothetical protein
MRSGLGNPFACERHVRLKDAYSDDEPPFAFDVDRDILRGLIRPGAVRGAVEAAQIRDCEGLS